MSAQTAERPLAAIAFQFACFACISANDVILKILVAELPSWQLMALRSGFGLLLLSPVILWRLFDGSGALATRRVSIHLVRGGLSAVSIFSYFEALRELDLPVATAILFVTPFFVVALSGLVLRERVTPNRWIAVAIGFAGALVIIRPGPAGVSAAALLALLSAATWAGAMVSMRNLGRTETTLSVIVYFNLLVALCAFAFAWPSWQPVPPRTLAIIAAVAMIQLASQFLMLTAFRFASASVVAPVQYSQLLWSVAAGWLVFSVVPGAHVFLGAAIIAASGLYLILTERRTA